MRFDGNYGAAVNYEPNSFGGPVEDPCLKEPPLKISGNADRYNHCDGNDDYTQPGNLFRLMTKEQREALFTNTADAMAGVPGRNQIAVDWTLCASRSRLWRRSWTYAGRQCPPPPNRLIVAEDGRR